MDCETLSIKAPAKINLFLYVLSRRPDGYHELSTWMQKLSLADRVSLKRCSSGITLQCLGADLPEDQGNLAFRAAALFFHTTGLSPAVEITLEKKIPVAAGLGGGSSDAAAVLTGLNKLFRADLNEQRLMEMGVTLGADIPFFVAQCDAAHATGIGEKLEKKKSLDGCSIVLVNPGFSVSTKWVFENYQPTQTGNLALTLEGNPYILAPAANSIIAEEIYNDLEKVTIKRYPEIASLKNKLMDSGATCALMSGSGPTVFGIFTDKVKASACAEELEKDYSNKVFLTDPLITSKKI